MIKAVNAVSERTHYLNLEQIDAVCAHIASRLLIGSDELIETLRRELIVVSANGLRSSALGQGLFGAHAPRPGLVPIAGPGGVGKTFFGELVARAIYGEHFANHLITINCHAYFAGRFPPLPRVKLDRGPLTVIAFDGVEVLPQMPPISALWTDAIRYGRAAVPVAVEPTGQVMAELSFGRCLIVATANVAREKVAHVGFRPVDAEALAPAVASKLIRDTLGQLFEGDLADIFSPDRWVILPPLARDGLRRLVDLQLAWIGDMLPGNSPPVEIADQAADRLIHLALASQSPNKTASLVNLLRSVVEPAVNEALLSASAPIPLRVVVTLTAGAPRAIVDIV
jgi:ATP-dependent Clp protease ATP-binding subunit ClpA